MWLFALLGLAALFGLFALGRWYATASTADIAQGLRTFVAVFSGLAGTGLLLTGRLGLAFITLVATVLAVRAVMRNSAGATPIGGAEEEPVKVETDLLRMTLDKRTGEVEGEVTSGAFAGASLGDLELAQLLDLLDEAQTVDPRSTGLIETYLDRRFEDWREAAAGTANGQRGDGEGAMDERTALEILGLEAGADENEIRAAHRRLMARLHPDSGGSNFLASQINRAKDLLLRRL